jgi:hypothetical protein
MSERIPANIVAAALVDGLPESVRKEVLSAKASRERLGLEPATVIGIRGHSIFLDGLLTAAQDLLCAGGDSAISVGGDPNMRLVEREGAIVLSLLGDDEGGHVVELPLPELRILSRERETRVAALEKLVRRIAPFGSEHRQLLASVGVRELSKEEAAALLEELWRGPKAYERQLREKFRLGQARLVDLDPPSLEYLEKTAGPRPSDEDVEPYLASSLQAHWRELIAADLGGGLEVCLATFVRADLPLVEIVAHVDDTMLYGELQKCVANADPVSLLGAVTLALTRQHDERMRSLVAEGVERLCHKRLERMDGADGYQLMNVLLAYLSNRIDLLPGSGDRPPLWRRLASFWHASLVYRALGSGSVDVVQFRAQVEEAIDPAGSFRQLIDLRQEPLGVMWALGSVAALPAQMLGRLLRLQARCGENGVEIPGSDAIEARRAEMEGVGELVWAVAPGPLEGHLIAGEARATLTDDIDRSLNDASPRQFLGIAARLALRFVLPEGRREQLRSLVLQDDLEEGHEEGLIGVLGDFAVVACCQRDSKLAGAIADRVVDSVKNYRAAEVIAAVRVLLIAAAAIAEEKEWCAWLSERFASMARRMPLGEGLSALDGCLFHIKRVSRVSSPVCSPADAILLAGRT